MEVLIIAWVLSGLASGAIMSDKGRRGFGGIVMVFLLGPLGLVIALAIGSDQAELEKQAIKNGKARKCSACAEVVRVEAVKCRHCGTDLPPLNKSIYA